MPVVYGVAREVIIMLAHLSHGGVTCQLVPSVHFFLEAAADPTPFSELTTRFRLSNTRSIAVHAATVNRTTETKEKEEESLNICPSERERRLKRKRQRYSRVERPKTWRKGLDQ